MDSFFHDPGKDGIKNLHNDQKIKLDCNEQK